MTQMSSSTDREFQQTTRLTAAVQQIYAAQAKIAENVAQFGDKAPVPVITEMILLATEAESLARAVPATPFQKLVIAQGYFYGSDLDKALLTLADADASALSPSDKVLIRRQIGIVQYNGADYDAARRSFSRALEALPRPTATSASSLKTLYFDTQLQWSIAELTSGHCHEASQHAEEFRNTISLYPVSLRKTMEQRTLSTVAALKAACG